MDGRKRSSPDTIISYFTQALLQDAGISELNLT